MITEEQRIAKSIHQKSNKIKQIAEFGMRFSELLDLRWAHWWIYRIWLGELAETWTQSILVKGFCGFRLQGWKKVSFWHCVLLICWFLFFLFFLPYMLELLSRKLGHQPICTRSGGTRQEMWEWDTLTTGYRYILLYFRAYVMCCNSLLGCQWTGTDLKARNYSLWLGTLGPKSDSGPTDIV